MSWSGRGLHNEGADKEIDEVMMHLLSIFFSVSMALRSVFLAYGNLYDVDRQGSPQ